MHNCVADIHRVGNQVWPKGDEPPIILMGLLDTVGAYGLPRIDALAEKPLTYHYRPFRDYVVSSEVQHVFQACSTHDRLTPFEACCVRRKEDYDETPHARSGSSVGGDDTALDRDQPVPAGHGYNVKYTTEEWWYPGGSGPAVDSYAKRRCSVASAPTATEVLH